MWKISKGAHHYQCFKRGLQLNSTKQLSLSSDNSKQHKGGENKIIENRKKDLESQGYNLSLTCWCCHNSYKGNDIRITKYLADGSVNYYALPLQCPECSKLFAKDSRQARRKEIICFFAEDKYDPKCVICGDDDYDKLELDHIAGDGKKERLERKDKPRRKNWEYHHKGEYQVLCKTCNRQKSDLTLETITPIYKNILKHSKKKIRKSTPKKRNNS